MTGRAIDLAGAYADQLGIETSERVGEELVAQFEHLSQFVLSGGMPASGKAGSRVVSSEAATAYGELWVLTNFLTDARNALIGTEAAR